MSATSLSTTNGAITVHGAGASTDGLRKKLSAKSLRSVELWGTDAAMVSTAMASTDKELVKAMKALRNTPEFKKLAALKQLKRELKAKQHEVVQKTRGVLESELRGEVDGGTLDEFMVGMIQSAGRKALPQGGGR